MNPNPIIPPDWIPHLRIALISVALLAAMLGVCVVSLWLASFFLDASLHINPIHAGLRAWPNAWLVWHDGTAPKADPHAGRRLAGAMLLGVMVAVGGPVGLIFSAWERAHHRHLYGSARFASEAEIRSAGLL